MLELFLCLGVLLLLAGLFFKKPKNFPPGPRRLPILGVKLRQPRDATEDLVDFVAELQTQYGDVIGLYLGNNPTIWHHDPTTAKRLLILEAFSGRFNDIVSITRRPKRDNKPIGTIFNDGPSWHIQRRFILKNLKDLGFGKRSSELIIQEEAKDLVDFLKKTKGQEFLVSNLFNIPVINILWNMVASKRFALDDPRGEEIMKHLGKNFQKKSLWLNIMPWLRFFCPERIGYNSLVNAMQQVHAMIREHIQEHRDTLDHNNPRDLIDIYLMEIDKDTTGEFTQDNLIMNVVDLFAAGSETTSTTMKWALLYLSKNTKVQERCREEIFRVVGTSRLPGLEDMKNLPYCEATICEVQRLGCIARIAVPHRTMQDTTFDGHFYPKDCTIFINLKYMMSSPKFWNKPEEFNPSRFIDSTGQVNRDLLGFLPFGVGKRVCLGESLAKQELSLFFSTLLQNLSFATTSTGIQPDEKKIFLGITRIPQDFHLTIHPL